MKDKINNLTNQELFKELEKRLPDFTLNEMANLSKLLMTNMSYHHKEVALGKIKEISPKFHDSVKKTVRELEQEKIEEQTEEIKKLLNKK